MSVNAAGARRPKTPSANGQGTVETRVRELIAAARGGTAPVEPPDNRAPAAPEEDVFFDCEVDGVRCVLARTHDDTLPALSPREQDIARMIAKGYPNKIIASVLDISVWTVSTHLRRIYAKLNVPSRAAMVSRMMKGGRL